MSDECSVPCGECYAVCDKRYSARHPATAPLDPMAERWDRFKPQLDAVYAAMATLCREAERKEERSHSAILIFDGAVDKLLAAALARPSDTRRLPEFFREDATALRNLPSLPTTHGGVTCEGDIEAVEEWANDLANRIDAALNAGAGQ